MNKITVYRLSLIPVIFATLPFVRKDDSDVVWADLPEDLDLIETMQDVVLGRRCISEFEGSLRIIICADIPARISEYKGNTGEVIAWRYINWKLWDIRYHLGESRLPCEAVSMKEAGIDQGVIAKLSRPVPIVNEIGKLISAYQKRGVNIGVSNKEIDALREVEALEISKLKLRRMKAISPAHTEIKRRNRNTIGAALRSRILTRDLLKCIFCGQDATSGEQLHCHHIVPVSLIRSLQLGDWLYDSETNLCTTCASCNQGRSDTITQQDIVAYVNAFKDAKHPNHGILEILRHIKHLQNSTETF